MKKHSLLLMATLIFAQTTANSKGHVINYSLFAVQAGGALYAITGIKNLLATETPTKELSPKKALEARIKKARDENKVWSGISVFLVGFLTQQIVMLYRIESATTIKAAANTSKK